MSINRGLDQLGHGLMKVANNLSTNWDTEEYKGVSLVSLS